MKKWITPSLIIILLLGTFANGFLYLKHVTIVRNDEARIANLQTDILTNIDAMTGNINGMSGSLSSLRADTQNLTENVHGLSGVVDNIQRTQKRNPGLVADFTNVFESVRPSVVVIDTQTATAGGTQQGFGSGWIISSNGLIVTNSHVVAGATSVKVTLADGRSFASAGMQADAAMDVAVIKISAGNLPSLKISDSATLKVGQPVAAVGNALGLGISMTGGLVSRLNISVALSEGGTLSGLKTLTGLIETDAVVNPGNSGGPLINMNGEVIGIATHKIARTDVEGMGHAIDIHKVMPVIDNLIAKM